jgi:hypothetical protein
MTTKQKKNSLETLLDSNIDIRVNNNHSTFLSVKWEADVTRVSMHKMFLQAPENIMDALACYIRREHKTISSEIKDYIEQQIESNYPSRYFQIKQRWDSHGQYHQLQEIYNKVNRDYFNNELSLSVTWFGQKDTAFSQKAILGLYEAFLKVVKVHRILDSAEVPTYVLEYIIYHEVLHSVCPPQRCSDNGRRKIHTDAFKKREKEFCHFAEATQWIEENKHHLFRRDFYGRS